MYMTNYLANSEQDQTFKVIVGNNKLVTGWQAVLTLIAPLFFEQSDLGLQYLHL